tara:strand:- start:201 stop:653 length:453 start_codon:yes stop_codon:yes gene_type:complete
MKNVLMIMALMMCLVANGQWTYKIIHSDFDGSFKRSFTATNNNGFLMMEESDTVNKPFLGLSGSYFCDDETLIEFVLVVKGVNKLYKIDAMKSGDSEMYYINDSIWTDEFVNDFKSASKCSIRVNQSYCTDEYYTFSFSGSTAAFNFITQ